MTNIDILEELLMRVRRLEHEKKPRPRNMKQAAEYMAMSVSKLQQLHKEGRGPKRSTVGRVHVYQEDDLDEYLKTNES
jgi:hypothetical protein